MADVHRRAAASSSRLTPEEITNRGFASAFRGLSETEVRNFLRRVADELVAMRSRESDLLAQVGRLEEQLRNPPPVTEEQLLSSLGEETARVLRSAQEAAEEIRKRAEERAAGLVREAQEESGRLRETAQQQATARREAAEEKATELEASATARATEVREHAEQEAEELREATATETGAAREQAERAAADELDAARASSRALVDEARTVRERVLADLGRRRSLLQAQVDELRSGRDRLLDAYRVVKRTLSDATDALAQVEARANAELAAPPARVAVPPVEGELEILEGSPAGSAPTTAGPDAPVEIDVDVVVTTEPPSARDDGSPEDADSGAAVDALFARLRASHTTDPEPHDELPAPESGPPVSGPGAEPDVDAATEEPDAEREADAEAGPEVEAATAPAPPEPEAAAAPAPTPPEPEAGADAPAVRMAPDDELRAARDDVMAPLARDLSRAAKRALQDQQNELLDQIRTVKGKVAADTVLPAVEAQEAAWAQVLEAPLRTAYSAGAAAIGDGDGAPDAEPPSELFEELARPMVAPWRRRLVSAIDGAADDPDAVTQRLGARYREYRGRELEDALGDALAEAWTRGEYAAVPEGTLLRWIPAEVGRCPDCDDNALEPTAKGAPFPTGQVHPPAHPGCRCFLTRAEPGAAN
ncbi:MAG TPA: DivIVA domain-containing protein [Acidimicrobiia bacterium]